MTARTQMAAQVGDMLVELHEIGFVHRQVNYRSVRLVRCEGDIFDWVLYNWDSVKKVGPYRRHAAPGFQFASRARTITG